MDTTMTTNNLHRQVETRLSTNDVRYTNGRRTIVDALVAANGPRSAAELHTDLHASVPLSSVYRTLAVLEEAEIVVPHFATKSLARYELAEWLTGHHHHLVCIDCGSVEDIDVPASYESQVDTLVSAISSASAFQPTNHALEIEGYCRRCA
jgi:Fe2+ or Zn2+ uptake regulation protein